MALTAFDGTFAKTAGPTTGSQAVVANIPFEPVGFRFWSFGGTSSGSMVSSRQESHGLAVPPGTGSRNTTNPFTSTLDQMARSILALTPSAIYGNAYIEQSCIYFHDNGGAFGTARNTAIGALSSVDNLGGGLWGFTINWTTNNAVDPARLIHYIAYGGVTPGTEFVLFNWAETSIPGTHAKPGVGFQPACILTLGGDTQPGPGPVTGPGYHLHWSAANCQLQQVGVSNAASNGGGANVGVREHSKIAMMPILSDEFHQGTSTLVSMDATNSGDGGGGFTTSVSSPSPSAYGYGCHSFAFKDVSSAIGSFVKQSTDTSAQSVSTPNVTPVVVDLFGDNNTVTGLQDFDRMAYGTMTTSGPSGCGAAANPRTPDTTFFTTVDYSNKAYAVLNNNTQTIQALLTKSALSAGSFAVAYDSNDSEATEILYAALGSGGGGTCAGPTAGSFAGTWVDTQMVPVFA